MYDFQAKAKFIFLSVDFILFNISFFTLNYSKRGTFKLPPDYGKLLLGFYVIFPKPARGAEPAPMDCKLTSLASGLFTNFLQKLKNAIVYSFIS